MNRLSAAVGAGLLLAVSAPALAFAQAAPATPVAPQPARTAKLAEGTEVLIRFNDKLSSGTNKTGDSFSITLEDDLKLTDGTVIHPGYRGRGEVTGADKKGMMGKAGELNIRFEYIRIGETRVRLRGSKGDEGKGAIGATVALTILFGPLGLIKKGHDVEIQPGQTMKAYVDQDAEITLPLAPPPAD